MSWTLFLIAAVGIPALYYKDQIGIGYVNLLGQYMAFAIVAVSLDLVWGYAGMLCLCQAFFFCLGGYAMGMYLAHHGGPEGIIDHNGWKLPACLYVVYPYKVGEAPADALVPWFWKPMWNLWSTLILGVADPRSRGRLDRLLRLPQPRPRRVLRRAHAGHHAGRVAGLHVERHQVRRHERTHAVRPRDPGSAGESPGAGRSAAHWRNPAVAAADRPRVDHYAETCQRRVGRTVPNSYLVSVPHGQHPWNMKEAVEALKVGQEKGTPIKLSDVADVRLAGFLLTDPQVKLGLYVLTVLALGGAYALCRFVITSRVGRVLIAIRDNENRFRFFGYEPYHFKVFVFALSGMLAGLGGMLYVPQKLIITPHNMSVLESIMVVIWVAVGGRGTLSGAILGTLVVKMMYYYFTSQREFLYFAKKWVPTASIRGPRGGPTTGCSCWEACSSQSCCSCRTG